MTIDERIAEYAKSIATNTEEQARLKKLCELYPDLQIYEGRWKFIVFCSKTVNPLVNKIYERFNCGCCGDSPLEIWPYLETEFGKIYSDPPMFQIAERRGFDGCVPYNNWEKKFLTSGLSEQIVQLITTYIRDANVKEDSEDEVDSDPLV